MNESPAPFHYNESMNIMPRNLKTVRNLGSHIFIKIHLKVPNTSAITTMHDVLILHLIV